MSNTCAVFASVACLAVPHLFTSSHKRHGIGGRVGRGWREDYVENKCFFARDFRKKMLRFDKNARQLEPSCSRRTHGRTHRHDDANSRFCSFAIASKACNKRSRYACGVLKHERKKWKDGKKKESSMASRLTPINVVQGESPYRTLKKAMWAPCWILNFKPGGTWNNR
jgi:hypothetical protein